jgi:hypothetical protein
MPGTRTRFMLTGRDAALRLGQVTALVAFPLPVGFHNLPREEQKRLVHDEMARALTTAEDSIDRDLVPA